jgi:GT2 family glycosyltransferase
MLKELVGALRSQTYPPNEIIVINQGQNADLIKWLNEQQDLTVYHQPNQGSAGGFSSGIQKSMRRGHDWTWIFDDDAIPKLDSLERLAASPYFQLPSQIVFMASRIVDRYGKTYMSPDAADANRWYATVLEDKCVEVTGACWLGLLVSSTAVAKYGLPVSEFFIGEEDIEFTERLARNGRAYCAIDSVIVHFQDNVFDPFGKDFGRYAYIARNKIGRAKLMPGTVPHKFLRTARVALRLMGQVIAGQAPLRSVPWILKGVFLFWPKIRYLPEFDK